MTQVATTLRSAYLAGPMRGIDEYNFPEFHKQAAWLRSMNWEVFSPAERDEADPNIQRDVAGWADGLGLDYFMSHDLKAVCEADCVILLNDWETSQGARLEAMVAVEISHPVLEIARHTLYRTRYLASVSNARIASEFIAATRAFDGLPIVSLV